MIRIEQEKVVEVIRPISINAILFIYLLICFKKKVKKKKGREINFLPVSSFTHVLIYIFNNSMLQYFHNVKNIRVSWI